MAEQEHIAWRGKTDGTPWMQRTLVRLFRWVPLGVLYGVMALVVPFYMLLDRKGSRASYSFARRRLGKSRSGAFSPAPVSFSARAMIFSGSMSPAQQSTMFPGV